jgi:hypothetical protein
MGFLESIGVGIGFTLGADAAIAIVGALTNGTKRDDSDAPNDGPRSGMRIYTDHRTGVQYLTNGPFGFSLTPRLDRDGNPILAATHQTTNQE